MSTTPSLLAWLIIACLMPLLILGAVVSAAVGFILGLTDGRKAA